MSTLAVILALTAAVTLASAGWRYRHDAYAWWVYLRRPRRPRVVERPDGVVTFPHGTLTEQQEAAFRAQWETPGGPATGEWRHNVRKLPRGGRSER